MPYQNDPMRVLTGEVRLMYLNVLTPRASQQGGEPKYSATLHIPKSDIATKADIDEAIRAAAQDALSRVWNGVQPPLLRIPIHDGDGLRPSGEPFGDECKGHWIITASTTRPPGVCGIDNINVDLAPKDIYSGMYGRVTIRFFGYSNSGNKGVGCGLDNIMKTRDGTPYAGGHASTASDFASVGRAVVKPVAAGGAISAQQVFAAPTYMPSYQPPTPAYQPPPPSYQPPPPSYQPPTPAYQPQTPAYQPPTPTPTYQPPTYAPSYQPENGAPPVNINPFTGLPM